MSPLLGGAEEQFLADAVRWMGPERFARFWQASAEPGAAFQAATGVALGDWTAQWLARTYGAPTARPRVAVGDLVWLAALAPFAVVIAVRRRERVLLDPSFARRT
jgi:anti-sigma factor RsiW